MKKTYEKPEVERIKLDNVFCGLYGNYDGMHNGYFFKPTPSGGFYVKKD